MSRYASFTTQYLLTKALFLSLGFKLLLVIAGPYLWISIILGIILGLLINHLLFKTPHEFLTFLSSFILLGIGIFILTKMIVRVYFDYSSLLLVLLPLLLLIYYTGSKKTDTIFKVSSIIFVIEVVLIFLAICFLIPEIKIDNLLINDSFSYKNILLGSFIFAIMSSFPYLLLPNNKIKYDYKAYLISSLTLLIIGFLMISSLNYKVSALYEYPEYFLFKRIHINSFIENIENILFMSWLIVYFPFLTLAYSNIKSLIKSKTLS